MRNVVVFVLCLIVAISMASCEKPGMEIDPITGETIDLVESLGITYSAPSVTSKNADPIETLTINGQVREFNLVGDHFYDDGRDQLVHFSQTYDTDLDGVRLLVYFNILIDIDANQAVEGLIEINDGEQRIPIQLNLVQVDESSETITYSHEGISFSLTL